MSKRAHHTFAIGPVLVGSTRKSEVRDLAIRAAAAALEHLNRKPLFGVLFGCPWCVSPSMHGGTDVRYRWADELAQGLNREVYSWSASDDLEREASSIRAHLAIAKWKAGDPIDPPACAELLPADADNYRTLARSYMIDEHPTTNEGQPWSNAYTRGLARGYAIS